jgi:hypothetical protein
MESQLQGMKIKFKEGRYILRWGRKWDENFQFKQAYRLASWVDTTSKRQIWDIIWNLDL